MNDINLVPVQYEQSFKRRWYIAGGSIGGIILIIGLSFLAYLPVYQINAAKKEQIDLERRLASEALAEVRDVIEEINLVEKEKSSVQRNLEEMNIPSHVSRKTMDIIVANAPEGIRINQVMIDRLSNTSNIRGSAQNVTSVAQYMVGLYNTEQFQDITYTTSQNRKEDSKWQVEYNIQIQLKSFEEEEIKEENSEIEEGGGEDAL